MEQLIAQYGALGVFLGAALEGQSAVVAGGLLAHQHLMSTWLTLACATAGSGLADQMLFVAGRRYRNARWVSRATARPGFVKALKFIERYPTSYILAFRFIYGLRLISPIAIGVSRVTTLRFTALNVAAALLWAGAFTALGYGAGGVIETFAGRHAAPRVAMLAAAALVLAVAAAMIVRALKRQDRADPS